LLHEHAEAVIVHLVGMVFEAVFSSRTHPK